MTNKTPSPAPRDRETADPATVLRVFDRLEVGPVTLAPRRLVAPYRIHIGGKTDVTELIYVYETPVFDPQNPECRNLADMIAAQAALNYGLFCSQIRFIGTYDATDRAFLRDMAENTAREIFVKKFLEPNPFLTGEAMALPAVRQKKYLNAKLKFLPTESEARFPPWRLWETDKNRHCVLSSGGKDSLLSFGLINELEREVHPLFVNESGRHWFTALNAYRHFRENIPRTGRVWVNSDRLFSWMLRRMPFIRKDFQSVRHDEYPIRLWTVAVFLFGVMPILRERKIGRLIIGDEHDTSRRTAHQGISHYDGLYDQSIWFDNTMSRYFQRKGWAVSQFSLLRPLSELLIEKILAGRYPDLQTLQISCHAAHKDGDRIRPCGKCEKCRRIVGMLTAVGKDPRRCGYTDIQIAACLKALAEKGTYAQTASEAAELLNMLAEKGRIPSTSSPTGESLPAAEILRIRFDPVISPINAIPVDLREPLYRIYGEYAQGAVRRAGQRWIEFDPLTDPEMVAPYPFELSPGHGATAQPPDTLQNTAYLWGELCWPDAEERFDEMDTVLLPVGAMEQHGPHLPLDTDAYDAEYLARCVAEACSDPKPMVLPLIPYGVSYHHDDFRGTVSIDNDTLSRLVYDIGMSVARNGFRKLVIINGHGGNSPALNHAAQKINRDARIFVCVDSGETSDVDIDRLVETPNDVHAGEIETSTALAVRPHLVRMDRIQRDIPEFSVRYLNFSSKRGISWYAHTEKISASGIMGDPTKATAAKGEQMWTIMIAHLTAFVEEIKHMTLDEIHQRRY